MTVIAAKIFDDEIHFAADRQVTAGFRKKTDREIEQSKLYSVNGMTIGGTGFKAHVLWLFSFARNHAPLEPTEVDVSHFMLEFAEWMRRKTTPNSKAKTVT